MRPGFVLFVVVFALQSPAAEASESEELQSLIHFIHQSPEKLYTLLIPSLCPSKQPLIYRLMDQFPFRKTSTITPLMAAARTHQKDPEAFFEKIKSEMKSHGITDDQWDEYWKKTDSQGFNALDHAVLSLDFETARWIKKNTGLTLRENTTDEKLQAFFSDLEKISTGGYGPKPELSIITQERLMPATVSERLKSLSQIRTLFSHKEPVTEENSERSSPLATNDSKVELEQKSISPAGTTSLKPIGSRKPLDTIPKELLAKVLTYAPSEFRDGVDKRTNNPIFSTNKSLRKLKDTVVANRILEQGRGSSSNPFPHFSSYSDVKSHFGKGSTKLSYSVIHHKDRRFRDDRHELTALLKDQDLQKQIRELSLSIPHGLHPDYSHLRRFRHLNRFELNASDLERVVTEGLALSLAQLKELKSLKFSFSRKWHLFRGNSDITALIENPDLQKQVRELSLSLALGMSPDLSNLGKFRDLTHLDLDGDHLDGLQKDVLASLAQLKKLETLKITSALDTPLDGGVPVAAFLAAFKEKPNLQELSLENTGLSDKTVSVLAEALKDSPNLKRLSISNPQSLDASAISKVVSSLDGLETLSIKSGSHPDLEYAKKIVGSIPKSSSLKYVHIITYASPDESDRVAGEFETMWPKIEFNFVDPEYYPETSVDRRKDLESF